MKTKIIIGLCILILISACSREVQKNYNFLGELGDITGEQCQLRNHTWSGCVSVNMSKIVNYTNLWVKGKYQDAYVCWCADESELDLDCFDKVMEFCFQNCSNSTGKIISNPMCEIKCQDEKGEGCWF